MATTQRVSYLVVCAKAVTAKKAGTMRTFEHKFAVNLEDDHGFDNPEAPLNLMGTMGWELVSVVSAYVPAGKGQPTLLYLFKREKEAQA